MALGSDPTAQQIANEFGNATRNSVNGSTNIANYDLKAMWERIFGSGTHDRKDFAGYGKPSISGFSATTSSTQGGYIDISFSITLNQLNSSVRVEYQENNGGNPDLGSWISLGSFGYTSPGSKSESVQLPNTETDYWLRCGAYNEFNDASINDYVYSNYDGAESSEPIKHTQPSISSADLISTTDVEIFWNYGSEPNSFSAQYRSSAVSQTNKGWSSTSNFGSSSNPKSGVIDSGESFPSNADVRIRADAGNGKNASDWSTWFPVNGT